MILAVSIAGGLATLGVSYWVIFKGWDDFCECVSYALQPDIYSWFQGELDTDWWAELKIYFWLAVSLAVGFAIHVGMSQVFT